MKSILIAVLCLGVGCVQAGLFKNEGNHVQRMLSRAGRSFGKRGHDEGGSCKQECDDYGLLAYVHGTLATLLIDCKTLEIYLNSGDDTAKRYNVMNFMYGILACEALREEADAEMKRYEDKDYKPEVYSCDDYEHFLLVMSCMGTYNTLASFYFATELHEYDHSKSEDALIWYLEQDMLHQCNDLFFGPWCLIMWFVDHEDKHTCHEIDVLFNFGDYFEDAQEYLCNAPILNGDNEFTINGQVIDIEVTEAESQTGTTEQESQTENKADEDEDDGDAGSTSESSEGSTAGGRRTAAERFEDLTAQIKAKLGKKASQTKARGNPFAARSKMDARKKNLQELESLLGKLLQRKK